jgi:hypothetical protein
VSEEQPVQVKDQAGIQRTPVLMEQVVLGVAVAGQFLFAPVTQGRGPPIDDPPSTWVPQLIGFLGHVRG